MNKDKIDIIKIGGSVITDKSEYRSLRKKQLSLISEEISKWNRKLILVHGAGSFGHYIAKQYSIHLGFSYQDQIKGVLQIREDMSELSDIVNRTLKEKGTKAISFQTSAIIFEDKTGYSCQFDPIRKALALDLTPVLSGDILLTENKAFKILSGDTLTNIIAENLEISRVIFISDVDGIFIQNKETRKNELVSNLSLEDLENVTIGDLKHEDSNDVTGEMKGKISEIKSLLRQVSEVIIVNGSYPDRLAAIRSGDSFIGTRLTSKNSTER